MLWCATPSSILRHILLFCHLIETIRRVNDHISSSTPVQCMNNCISSYHSRLFLLSSGHGRDRDPGPDETTARQRHQFARLRHRCSCSIIDVLARVRCVRKVSQYIVETLCSPFRRGQPAGECALSPMSWFRCTGERGKTCITLSKIS